MKYGRWNKAARRVIAGTSKIGPHHHECAACRNVAACANKNCTSTDRPLCAGCFVKVSHRFPSENIIFTGVATRRIS